jgi:hypothetical protein
MSFTCFDCQKEFSSQDALNQHKHVAHKHSESTKKKSILPWIFGIFIVIGIIAFYASSGSGKYDGFAKCISDSGAKFYGAFWCSHCAEQKALFGSSAKYLPYIECSTPDKNGEFDVCKNAGINGYPTWIFADGSRTNQLTLQELSQKTGCALP